MKKRSLDRKGYASSSINISDDLWFYEEGKGIEIYYRRPGQLTQQIILPWRKLDETLERRRKVIRKRRSRS